jgi:hypothetical protein
LSRLTYVYAWAILAFEPIDPTIIISAIVWFFWGKDASYFFSCVIWNVCIKPFKKFCYKSCFFSCVCKNYDSIENTLEILNFKEKGTYLNTLERFHIYKAKKTGGLLNNYMDT